MRKSKLLICFILAPGFTSTALGQTAPNAVNIRVTSQVSSPMGIIPSPPGISPVPGAWFYLYTIPAGGSVTDTIPVQYCAVASRGIFNSVTIDFQPTTGTGNLPGTSISGMPIMFTTAGAGVCQTAYINLLTGALSPGTYNLTLDTQFTSKSPNALFVNLDRGLVHIRVVVQAAPSMSCFATDSSGNFFLDCDGNVVNQSGGSAGRFAIVANKKNIEVATNPGQFYYNAVWTNSTGSDQTVRVDFVRTGVNPKGTQAIHASVFPPPFSGFSTSVFDTVNDDIPSGADDALENITVPNGWSLVVTYHLEWSGLGSLVPANCATTCTAANQCWSVQATVSGQYITTSTCTTGACGYKKK